MALFLIGGLVFLFLGSKDLLPRSQSAERLHVPGTGSLFCILGKRRVARWSYAFSFFCAMAAGAIYMLEAGGRSR